MPLGMAWVKNAVWPEPRSNRSHFGVLCPRTSVPHSEGWSPPFIRPAHLLSVLVSSRSQHDTPVHTMSLYNTCLVHRCAALSLSPSKVAGGVNPNRNWSLSSALISVTKIAHLDCNIHLMSDIDLCSSFADWILSAIQWRNWNMTRSSGRPSPQARKGKTASYQGQCP